MTPNELITELNQRDVRLWVDGDQLRVRASKGVLTLELRELLIRHKAELLSTLRQRNGTAGTTAIPLTPILRDGNLPLSFAQQGLWFLDRLEPTNLAYNIPVACRLTGMLNISVLERSLNEIVRRHEVLRTTFSIVNEQPIQIIAPSLTLPLPVVDLRGVPETEREVEARRIATEEAQKPFNLAVNPLLRATLLRLGEEHHIWGIIRSILYGEITCSS
jgi:hypothetical protein